MIPSSIRRPRAVIASFLIGVSALVAVASAAPARTTFPVPVPGTGTPTEVAASHGTLAWLTVDAGTTTLHLDRRGTVSTTTVAATAGKQLRGLSVGTDAAGRPVVLAVRGAEGRGQDVVRIDPTAGTVSPVPVAARSGVEESAAAVEHGVLVWSRRAGNGKDAAILYRSPLTGTRPTRFRAVAQLPSQPGATRSVDVDELAIAPGSTTTSRLTVAARVIGDAEFGSQAIDVARRSGTPRRVVSWVDGGAGTSRSIGGLTWETATRLWYADVDELDGSATTPFASRVVRYSTATRRQAEVRTAATVDDLAWVDAARGAVGVVRDSTDEGVADRVGGTGPMALTPYVPRGTWASGGRAGRRGAAHGSIDDPDALQAYQVAVAG